MPRQLTVLLAALTALAFTGLAGIATAAATRAGAQNRVWAQNGADHACVGHVALEFPCSRPGSAPGSADLVSGFCVATEEASAGEAAGLISDPDQLIGDVAQSQADKGQVYLETFLSDREQEIVDEKPGLVRAFLGSAVQRATADELNVLYPGRFISRGVGPDFLDTQTGQEIELTTPGQVGAHLARGGAYTTASYGTYTIP